jgi:uncharacterized protein YjbI with pentapeptide repeats
MRQAARAPVKPRIVSPATGASLPLEDEVQSLLDRRGPAVIHLLGGPGRGKTTALNHLAAVFPHASRLCLVDDVDDPQEIRKKIDDVVVYVAAGTPNASSAQMLALAGWKRDEFIEYLLASDPNNCAAVMARISRDDELELEDVPEIWRTVLDELARDASLANPAAALVRFIDVRVSSEPLLRALGMACLQSLIGSGDNLLEQSRFQQSGELPAEVARLLRHDSIRRLLAAAGLAADLREPSRNCVPPANLPLKLVRATARHIGSNEVAISRLQSALKSPAQQPMAASLLHALNAAWKPSGRRPWILNGAYLDGVSWPGVRLRDSRLANSDLSRADLQRADLSKSLASHASFRGANLAGASLARVVLRNADLSGANLSAVQAPDGFFLSATLVNANLEDGLFAGSVFAGADLRHARLRHANLSRANFVGASIDDADFTHADLTKADLSGLVLCNSHFEGARFRKAILKKADLEGMQLDGVHLRGANLEGALLTGSSMVGGDLSYSCLRSAGLADVEWEGVSLQGADLSGASFHLGSSRSGLVSSPIASEGSRTGFYTDDFAEQDFKAPEEIRKANLRNADLRGANIADVDFYLVDLRGARYDTRQEDHFRRCGAILEDRCPQ